MALFLSSAVMRIDAKGRVSVPAAFRAPLLEQTFKGVVAFPSYEVAALDACGMDRMEGLAASLDQPGQYSPDEWNLAAMSFGEAAQLAFDSNGRILLPHHLCQHAGLEDEVLFVGKGVIFQMWRPSDYHNYKKTILERAGNQGISPRLRPIPRAYSATDGGA